MASRYCRFASKYCRIAGVAPAGSLDAGGEDIGRELREVYIADLRLKIDDWRRGDPRARYLLGGAAARRSIRATASARSRSSAPATPPRTHGERLPRELMARAGARPAPRSRTSIASPSSSGPGSFTGLRVGIATIQGLALARRTPVTPVSTLRGAGLARATPSGRRVATWVDAHRGEVFATLFAATGARCSRPPTSLTPAATLEAWRRRSPRVPRVRFIGDGAVRYRDVIRARARRPGATSTRRGAAARRRHRPDRGADARSRRPPARRSSPLYVRRPDVELARDRREAAPTG